VAANAVAGRPGGRIPYGYRRVFDPRTRQLIAQEPEPAEADVVAELYQRLIQGHSLRAIARDFEARGIRTRTGLVFTSQHLRSVALSPVYAALRAHRPTGHPGGWHAVLPVEQLYEGQWPAVVSRADWLAVQCLLRSLERETTRPRPGQAPAVADRPLRHMPGHAGSRPLPRAPGVLLPHHKDASGSRQPPSMSWPNRSGWPTSPDPM
jgi:site-specific DNA recombinase